VTPHRRLGILATHPIQYYAPWYRELAKHVDLEVFFSHRQTAREQAAAGFGVDFDWDLPLLDGYRSQFLRNTASRPDVNRFFGCITPELTGIIREGAFDAFIVHGWSTVSYWQAIQACWRTRTPVLVRGDSHLGTPRPPWRRALKWPLHRWFIPKFDGYLVVGARSKEYLMHYGANAERCFMTPHAVDNARFEATSRELKPQRDRLRGRFGLSPDSVVYLFAGKFIDVKRPRLFVEGLARAAASAPRIEGLMVGDGPLRAEIEAAVRSLKAPVRFAGFLNQQEMPTAYASADVLVLPSASETWGLVVNEAMASGLPAIVSSTVGCAPDLIVSGETGDVFQSGDAEALSAVMSRFASDADVRTRMSVGAQARVKVCSIDAAVSGTLTAVDVVMSGHALAAAQPSMTGVPR
jgi:glycosyltransferase involved in cell wall biosynthesis